MNPMFLQMLFSQMFGGGGGGYGGFQRPQMGYGGPSPWGGGYFQQQPQFYGQQGGGFGDPWGSWARANRSMDQQSQQQAPQSPPATAPAPQPSQESPAPTTPQQYGMNSWRSNMTRGMQRY